MNNYLSEAFKKLDILDEDVFELDKDGLTALKDFEDSDEDDMITVVDPDAESEEDLEDSYIGKVILDCSVCHTDIYKDKEDITIDEESGLANIGEECPYCYSSDGFKVIGEVKPFVEVEADTDDDVDVEVDGEEVEEDEEKNESLRRNRRLKESQESKIKFIENKLNSIVDHYRELYDHVSPDLFKNAVEQVASRYNTNNFELLNDISYPMCLTAPYELFENNDNYFCEILVDIDRWSYQTSDGDVIDNLSELINYPKALKYFEENLHLFNDCIDVIEQVIKSGKLESFSRRNRRLKESIKDWEFFEATYDEPYAPYTPKMYIKYPEGNDTLQVIIYPPQEGASINDKAYTDWGAEIYSDDDRNISESEEGFSSFDEAEKWVNSKLSDLGIVTESLKESCSINQCQKWVDYDMKKYKRISDDTMEKIKSSGYSVVKDQYGDYEVIADRKDTSKNEACGGKRKSRKIKESIEDKLSGRDLEKFKDKLRIIISHANMMLKDTEKQDLTYQNVEDYMVVADGFINSLNKIVSNNSSIKESIEDITIDTGDQEISVSARDKEEVKSDGEMIAPLSDEVKADIETGSDDTVDVDVDDFSEEDFDELGESYLKKVYENVNGYKTTSAKTKGNKLYVEGLIKFNSGKEKKTSFVFESRTITKTGKAKLIGENLQISRGHKSFKLTGTINNGKFISESLNYNYRVKNGSSSQRVYGTAKKSK